MSIDGHVCCLVGIDGCVYEMLPLYRRVSDSLISLIDRAAWEMHTLCTSCLFIWDSMILLKKVFEPILMNPLQSWVGVMFFFISHFSSLSLDPFLLFDFALDGC